MNSLFSNAKAMAPYIHHQLTGRVSHAIRHIMEKRSQFLMAIPLLCLAGCVQVNAPDKPIVVNLNIAISQEIIYKLDEASKKVIADNAGIY